jgi:hypothetical protein
MTHIAKLTTEGVHLFGNYVTDNIFNLKSMDQLESFVNRNVLNIETSGKLQTLLTYRDMLIGYGLIAEGKLKSQFPKAGWPFTLTLE